MTRSRFRFWLIQDAEPLPTRPNASLMRTGLLAKVLAAAGHRVEWFTGRFDHANKLHRPELPERFDSAEGYSIVLLDGPGYNRNISLERIVHHRRVADHFLQLAATADGKPELMLISYPSPELCVAAASWATAHDVPYVVDIRDAWPDIFSDYLPPLLRPAAYPFLVSYRRLLRKVLQNSAASVSVSEGMLNWALSVSGRARRAVDRVFYIGREPLDAFAQLPEGPFTAENPLRCLYCGSLTDSYDLPAIFDAASTLLSENEQSIAFTIAGSGEAEGRWRQKQAALPNVRMTGYLDRQNLHAELKSHHIGLCLLSGALLKSKHWAGNKVFEYFSAGLALLTNSEGDLGQLVRDGNCGVVCNAGSLKQKLLSLKARPGNVASLMMNSQAAFQRRFNAEQIYSEYAELLEGLCLDDKSIAR